MPRYDPFHPGRCGVYATHVAYMEIECQSCRKRFRVAVDVDEGELLVWRKRGVRLPTPEDEGDFYYGDAPYHENGRGMCAGTTMCSITRKILEFWVRDKSTGFEWKRVDLGF